MGVLCILSIVLNVCALLTSYRDLMPLPGVGVLAYNGVEA